VILDVIDDSSVPAAGGAQRELVDPTSGAGSIDFAHAL
jgi:hypothetical protein